MTNIEVMEAKNKQLTIRVGDIHLHSPYDPLKEAQSFISEIEKNKGLKRDCFVFGSGLGHHLNVLENKLQAKFLENYSLICIEPIKEIYTSLEESKVLNESSLVKVIHHSDVRDYFDDSVILNQLKKNPTLIIHPASYQISKDFFNSFLQFSYPRTLNSCKQWIESEELYQALARSAGDSKLTIDESLSKVKSKFNCEGMDFLLLTLNEMVSGSQKLEGNS